MSSIRQIQELNRRELENNVSPNASWHTDYRDTAYLYIGGLPFELSEGDVITIFSQYGEPTYINLIRDKETGKSRGFAFLKYEDQRSTDLAVDNLGGAVVMGRTLKVDHTRYKRKEGEEEQGIDLDAASKQIEDSDGDGESRRKKRRTSDSEEDRPILQEELELAKLIREHDEDDPMKAFLVQEKRDEVALALTRIKKGKSEKNKSRKRHRHSSRKDHEGDEDRNRHSRHEKDRDVRNSRRSPSLEDVRDRHSRDQRSEQSRRNGNGERRRSRERDQERTSRRGEDSGRHRSRRGS